MQTCHVKLLGTVPYQIAWDLQSQLANQIAVGELPATLLLLEHPHTITFGRSGKIENLLWNEAQIKEHGVEVFWVDRGGDVTYHGPGQLVGYPLLPLGSIETLINQDSGSGLIPQADYIGYLRKLEQVIIHALREFGLHAERYEKLTGVWINHSKIAAIGVKVDARGITHHGFALNVAPDMSYWNSIIGCGLSGYNTTCIADLLPDPPSMQQVIRSIISAFEGVFQVKCQIIT